MIASRFRAFSFVFLCGFLFPTGIHSQDFSSIVSHDDIRLSLLTKIVTAPIAVSEKYGSKTVKGKEADALVSVVTSDKELLVEFLRAEKPDLALFMPGDYVIRRNRVSSFILDFKMFLSEDGMSYILVYPYGSNSRMDVVVEGTTLYSKVNLALPIYHLLAKPFSSIVSLSEKAIDWVSVMSMLG